MLANIHSELDLALEDLTRAVAQAQRTASSCTSDHVASTVILTLRASDALIATALSFIQRGAIESSTGLSPEIFLSLDARRTGGDARTLVHAAETLRAMPYTSAAFTRGLLSWGQVRAIVTSVRTVDLVGRAQIDTLIDSAASTCADPDELVVRVDEECA